MTDRPILFSAPMVRALLAGTKTQTRRVSKIQNWDAAIVRRFPHQKAGVRFSPGDRLYVREHWRTVPGIDDMAPRDMVAHLMPVRYEAAGPDSHDAQVAKSGRFRQGMHMPKWASRLTLHVTEVRVQRLQEINDRDAVAEGSHDFGSSAADFGHEVDRPYDGAIEGYRLIWEEINGPGSWAANPWVTAITFAVERCNITMARPSS